MNLKRYAIYAWFVLIFNLGVVLWGAYVRATGSGAGCGSHWPLCNGEIIPRAQEIATIIEFSHRLSSGAAFLLVVGLFIFSFRSYPKGHQVRLGASLSLLFIVTEALVGAGLVLFEWVADDASLGRAISMAIHLVNTFLLLASITLTAWWASGGEMVEFRNQRGALLAIGFGILGVIVLGITGAITALGDTLFPASSLLEGVSQDLDPTAHFLIRLRVWHPLIAITTGLYIIFVAGVFTYLLEKRYTKQFASSLIAIFIVQLGAGIINLLLLAPVWMQIIHLLLADLVWINFVLFSAAVFAKNGISE
jgi:heme A synthase